jgi:hypothetical protein
MITFEHLTTIRVLWRQPDTMALWGIPYEMREGQSPYDLWKSTREPDTRKIAAGWYGATLVVPGPRQNWIWLGTPGWWGNLSILEQATIQAFLKPLAGHIPGSPCEWAVLPIV